MYGTRRARASAHVDSAVGKAGTVPMMMSAFSGPRIPVRTAAIPDANCMSARLVSPLTGLNGCV